MDFGFKRMGLFNIIVVRLFDRGLCCRGGEGSWKIKRDIIYYFVFKFCDFFVILDMDIENE